MVSVEEARSQIATQRAALESQKQSIQRISIPPPTPTELRKRGKQQLVQVQIQAEQLEGRKKQALQSLKPFEQELNKFESEVRNVEQQIKEQKKEQAAFNRALKAFQDPDPRGSFFLSGAEQKFFRQISAGKTTAIRLEQEKIVKELQEKGFEPIFVDGEIKGLRDLIQQQEIELKLIEPKFTPAPPPIKDIITFGQPEKFAESFRQATGSTSFTLAIPLARENGKIRVRDFNFRFEQGKLVRSKPTGSALLTEKQFLAADARRRLKAPGFTFGSTVITPLPKEDTIIPQLSKGRFKDLLEKGGKRIQELGKKATKGLEIGKEATLSTIFPFFRKETNLVNSENKRLKNEFTKLNNSINTFNNKFQGELNETQLKLAENQRIVLNNNIDKFLNLQNQTEENRTKRINDRQRLFFEEAVKSTGVGAVSLVFDIPKLIIGGVTQPIKTFKEVTKGVGKFPSVFATQPATVIGFLGGQVLLGQGVGGLTGIRGVPKLKGKAKTKITEADLNSQIFIVGKAKDKIIRNVADLDSGFKILNDQGKITNTIAYKIKTADGRTFEVLEFSKATGVSLEKGLAGVREILAFEIKKPGQVGEVLVGRAAQKITSQGGQSFVDLIRFKVPKTVVGRFRQRITGGGAKRFEILQKSKLETSKTIGGITRIRERTEAGIVRVSNAQRNITRNALIFSRELRKGRSIESVLGRNLSKLRSLINVERRLKGKKIFNQAEFEATFSKTLSQTELLSILDELSITGLIKTSPLGIGSRLVGKRKTFIAGGADIKKLPKPFPKLKKPTPLKKTFVKEKVPKIKPSIKKLKDKFGKFREARLVTKDKIKGAKAPKLKSTGEIKRKPSPDLFPQEEIVRLPPTVAPSVSLALTRPLTSFGSPQRFVVTTGTGIKSTQGLLPTQKTLLSLRTKINQLERTRQELRQIPKTQQTQFTSLRLANIQKTAQILRLRLTQIQKLVQLKKLKPITPIKPPKTLPIIIIPPLSKGAKRLKKSTSPFQPKGKGYNVFVKSKGKFMRVNVRAITKNKARDLGAFVIDQSLGATFKIRRTNMKAKKPKIILPRDYFGLTKNKYRPPIKKGKVKPIKNIFIEKRKNRLDTLREVKKIQAAKFISQLRKKAQKRIKPFKFKRV